jgi:hypothetical protein
MALKGPLKEAYDKAVTEAAKSADFARDHPVWTTLIALGILAVLLPWVIEALGFGVEGPVAREFVLCFPPLQYRGCDVSPSPSND